MSRQYTIFAESEGDAYHLRNREYDDPKKQHLLSLWRRLPFRPEKVLEIGCGAGGNLAALRREFGVDCYGVEPSPQAVDEGMRNCPELHLQKGSAAALPFADASFECVLFGFSLCWFDRQELFKIAHEADRTLRAGGALIILDFNPPFPYRNTYRHRPGLYSYKMRYADMFTWNPCYVAGDSLAISLSHEFSRNGDLFDRNPDNRLVYTVLHKSDPESCYLTDPFAI